MRVRGGRGYGTVVGIRTVVIEVNTLTTRPLERIRYRVSAERQKRWIESNFSTHSNEQLGAQLRNGWEAGIRTPITWSRVFSNPFSRLDLFGF